MDSCVGGNYMQVRLFNLQLLPPFTFFFVWDATGRGLVRCCAACNEREEWTETHRQAGKHRRAAATSRRWVRPFLLFARVCCVCVFPSFTTTCIISWRGPAAGCAIVHSCLQSLVGIHYSVSVLTDIIQTKSWTGYEMWWCALLFCSRLENLPTTTLPRRYEKTWNVGGMKVVNRNPRKCAVEKEEREKEKSIGY